MQFASSPAFLACFGPIRASILANKLQFKPSQVEVAVLEVGRFHLSMSNLMESPASKCCRHSLGSKVVVNTVSSRMERCFLMMMCRLGL